MKKNNEQLLRVSEMMKKELQELKELDEQQRNEVLELRYNILINLKTLS